MIHALLGGKTRSAGEPGAHFRSAQPTISRHLKVLESARLIELTVLVFDFMPGGAYHFDYDVSVAQRMIVGGVFRVIEAPVRMVFSWLIEPPDEHAGIESEVTVQLVPRGASTELTIRHAKFGRADADLRHEQGWRGALDLLEARLRGANQAGCDESER